MQPPYGAHRNRCFRAELPISFDVPSTDRYGRVGHGWHAGPRRRHSSSALPARSATWKGSRTATASGSSSAAAVLNRLFRVEGAIAGWMLASASVPGQRCVAGGPILCHRSQRTSSRTRSDRSTAHPIAQMKHPVALNHHVGILQQVLCVDRPEGALAGPEHDGYDVLAHLVDQAQGKDTLPPTSPAATSTMRSPASSCALATAASTPSTK